MHAIAFFMPFILQNNNRTIYIILNPSLCDHNTI